MELDSPFKGLLSQLVRLTLIGTMNKKEFDKLVVRDSYCLHCGETVAVSPNHRANRGMGGSKERDVPSNLMILCSQMNSAIESNLNASVIARAYGWKLNSWADPKKEPIFDAIAGVWYLLDDNYGRIVAERL